MDRSYLPGDEAKLICGYVEFAPGTAVRIVQRLSMNAVEVVLPDGSRVSVSDGDLEHLDR
ncbi:MAG TPA: hypothetical protein PKD55_25515 [Bellilinea sp.]|jgi:hypothetical protein|nr:hypothetical protein [Bellilinea sp.]